MTKWICDGCGESVDYDIEKNSDDGYNYFCDECWKELEAKTEVLNNQKMEDRE